MDQTDEEVDEHAMSRGHSTPQMAGRFASSVGARMLLLNHFSQRYSGDPTDAKAVGIMAQIAAMAARHFDGTVITAYDQLVVPLPSRRESR